MCRRARLTAAALSLATTMIPGVGSAQGRTALQSRQERVLTLHVANALAVRGRLKAFEDSTRRDRSTLDSLQVGPLRLLVETPFRARTEIAARVAAARLDSIAGTAVAQLAANRIVVRSLRGHLDSVEVSVPARDFHSGLLNDSALARWIGDRAITVFHANLGWQFHAWLKQSAVLRPDTVRTETWTQLRLQVVSSPSFVSQRCYDGDIRACSVGLGLTHVADPVTQWYDAEGRRRIVTAGVTLSDRRRPASASRCVAGDDTGCVDFLRADPGWAREPIELNGRFALAQLAIEMGGRQGYERLLNATGSPAARLAAAAGVPLDSVLSVWRSRVRSTRAQSVNVTPALGVASLAWILLCAGLSLRSSRWR